MDDLYKRIKMLCAEHDTNITELCRETGIGRNTIMSLKYKGRAIGMKPRTVKKIADYFGITPEEFLQEDPTDVLDREYNISSTVRYDGDKAMENAKSFYSEMAEMLQDLHDRPELKILYDRAKTATPEEIAFVTSLFDTFYKELKKEGEVSDD